MPEQLPLPTVRDGLWHTVCRQPITCRRVPRFPALDVDEMVPFCARCACDVPVKELA